MFVCGLPLLTEALIMQRIAVKDGHLLAWRSEIDSKRHMPKKQNYHAEHSFHRPMTAASMSKVTSCCSHPEHCCGLSPLLLVESGPAFLEPHRHLKDSVYCLRCVHTAHPLHEKDSELAECTVYGFELAAGERHVVARGIYDLRQHGLWLADSD